MFYSYFAGLGLDITVEDSTSHGRLDMAVRFNANVYLLELKVVEMAGEGAAMARDHRASPKWNSSWRTLLPPKASPVQSSRLMKRSKRSTREYPAFVPHLRHPAR